MRPSPKRSERSGRRTWWDGSHIADATNSGINTHELRCESPVDLRVHAGVEHHVSGPTLPLGPVHGDVRLAQEGVRPIGAGSDEGYPDARRSERVATSSNGSLIR